MSGRGAGGSSLGAMSAGLHTRRWASRGRGSVFCHGLFGQGKNWTTIAKRLAERHRVLLVDMPNHGRSEWTEAFDYFAAADQVAGLLSANATTIRRLRRFGGDRGKPFGQTLETHTCRMPHRPQVQSCRQRCSPPEVSSALANFGQSVSRESPPQPWLHAQLPQFLRDQSLIRYPSASLEILC